MMLIVLVPLNLTVLKNKLIYCCYFQIVKMSQRRFVEVHSSFGVKKDWYKVNSDGQIWSFESNRFVGSDSLIGGYKKVRLSLEPSGTGTFSVHIITKVSFDGPTPKGMVIDHIDRIKSNNSLSNLRFATRSENSINSTIPAIRRYGTPLLQFEADGETLIDEWLDAEQAAEELGIVAESIRRCCRGEIPIYQTFVWAYDKQDLPDEIWKEIKVGSETVNVSSCGRVKLWSDVPRYGAKNANGYMMSNLESGGYQVHRLVCEAFHGPSPFEGAVVNHKDKDKTNNRPENLEWITVQQNIEHSLGKAVLQYDRKGVLIKEYPSAAEAGRQTKIDSKQISACCTGTTTSAGDFIWKYKDSAPSKPTGVARNRKPVEKLSRDGRVLEQFESIAAAARSTQLQAANIGKVLKGERPVAGGFGWRFANTTTEYPPGLFD